MRYLAWRSRAGTGGSGGDDLAEAPRMPKRDGQRGMGATGLGASGPGSYRLRAGRQAGRLVGFGQAGRTRRSDGRAEAA